MAISTRGAVIGHQSRIIDREIGRPLLKIRYWIVTKLHDFHDQVVGIYDRLSRFVDKFGLDSRPISQITLTLADRKWTNIQSLDMLLPFIQLGLGFLLVPHALHSVIILRSEVLLEPLRPFTASKNRSQ